MANTDPEARYYHWVNGSCVCELCPHSCTIDIGQFGSCHTRYATEDGLVAKGYGRISALCIDPIEKKPLYHYRPGSEILSVGGIGCNMTCRHCQNHGISQAHLNDSLTRYIAPDELTRICREQGLDSIAFTYNEPMISYEYIMDTMRSDPGIRYVLVTNGLINEGPLKDLCEHIDAMNIDVKGFTEGFYTEICGAELEDVKRTVSTVFDAGIHTEITYLLIPGYNDSEEELHNFAEWIGNELSVSLPVHLTRFHPDNMMTDVKMTPLDTMIVSKRILTSSGLEHVYLGNTDLEGQNDTVCPSCGSTLFRRRGFETEPISISGSACSVCGHHLRFFRMG